MNQINHTLLVDQRGDLERFLNQAIACKRLQGHRQQVGVDDMHSDNLKAVSAFVPLKLHGVTDFEFFPNQIIEDRLRREQLHVCRFYLCHRAIIPQMACQRRDLVELVDARA